MTWLWVVGGVLLGLVVWTVVALPVGMAIGRAIRATRPREEDDGD